MVRTVALRGKGNVIRRMFADVEADIYVLVDGDDTDNANATPTMIDTLLADGLNMVVGTRVSEEQAAYRFGHRFGNVLLTPCVSSIYGRTFTDMLSGFRVFSRRYVKSFPAHASGFETETELTVHALELRMHVAETPTVHKSRPEGSASKHSGWPYNYWRFLVRRALAPIWQPVVSAVQFHFPSPLTSPISVIDTVWLPKSFLEALAFPFIFSLDSLTELSL